MKKVGLPTVSENPKTVLRSTDEEQTQEANNGSEIRKEEDN